MKTQEIELIDMKILLLYELFSIFKYVLIITFFYTVGNDS